MTTSPTFKAGQTVASNQVSELSAIHTPFSKFVWLCLTRHKHGDWGDCSPEDQTRNKQALQNGARLFSVYLLPQELQFVHRDRKLWIITEADRSTTIALFPSEY